MPHDSETTDGNAGKKIKICPFMETLKTHFDLDKNLGGGREETTITGESELEGGGGRGFKGEYINLCQRLLQQYINAENVIILCPNCHRLITLKLI